MSPCFQIFVDQQIYPLHIQCCKYANGGHIHKNTGCILHIHKCMHIWLVCLSTSLHYKVTVYDLTMLGTQALISFPRSFLSLPPLLSISHMHKRNIVFPRIEFPLQLLSAVPTGLAVTHDQSSGAFSRVSGPVSEHCLGHQIKISIRCIVASKPNK